MSLLHFGPFALDPMARTLSREGRAIELQPLAFDLLAHGAEHPGVLLDRDSLQSTLWPDVVVTDHSLTQLVHRIRKALGEHKGLWVTVPRRGYRFDAEVDAQVEPAQPRPPSLRVRRDDFVGREDELAQLAALLLLEHPHPVLIHGPGGAGKTRLALEFLEGHREVRPLVSIDLASDQERADVVVRVASTLAIELPAGASSEHEARISRALAHRASSLILVDNLEQLSEPARELLAAWMQAAPHHGWLATSRDLVDLPNVIQLPLPPLPVEPAVALFTARGEAAGAAAPAPDDPDLHAVLSVLEGSPLAIELAAARLPLLSLGDMRARLADVLSVLAGRRIGNPRHRSMATATAWSWELLDDEERLVLMAGALFPQTFTLAAVESTVRAARPDLDTLRIMHRLMDLSLLQTAAVQPGRQRGRLSYARTVRAFVLEQLEGSEHQAPLARGFTLTMQACLERAKPLLTRWDAALAREMVQELPALEAGLQPDQCDRKTRITLGRLCGLLYALHRGGRILGALGEARPEDGGAYWSLFFAVAPRSEVRRALSTEPYRELLDRGGLESARLCQTIGAAASEFGDVERAMEALERARDLAPPGNPDLRAAVSLSLAILYLRTGDIDRAEAEAEAGLKMARGVEPAQVTLPGLLDLRGYLYTQRSRFAEAKRYQIEAQELALALGLERIRATSLCNLASTLQEGGEFEAALERLDLALELAGRHGDPAFLNARANRGLTLLHLGRPVQARKDLLMIDRETAGPWLYAVATISLAAVDASEHRWEAARATAERAMETLQTVPGLTVWESAAMLWLTLACHRLGDADAVDALRQRQSELPTEAVPPFVTQAWEHVTADIEGREHPVPDDAHALVRLVARVRRGPLTSET